MRYASKLYFLSDNLMVKNSLFKMNKRKNEGQIKFLHVHGRNKV